MEQTGFIVAVDFGATKIRTMLGRKHEKGIISVQHTETIDAAQSVRRGMIVDPDEAAKRLKSIIQKLENVAGDKILKIYTAINGPSLHTQQIRVDYQIGEEMVSLASFDRLKNKAKFMKIGDGLHIYYADLIEIYLDSVQYRSESDVLAKRGKHLEGVFNVVAGNKWLKDDMEHVMKKLKLKAEIVPGPLVTAEYLLEASDQQNGCALIDFGASSTSLAIYTQGIMRHISSFSLGGDSITGDIATIFNIDRNRAEEYKTKYGSLDKSKMRAQNNDRPNEVTSSLFGKVIELRSREIIENVLEKIKHSGFAYDLQAGIVVTGGASQIDFLCEYLAKKSGMKVKKGVYNPMLLNNLSLRSGDNQSYSRCLALLLAANDNDSGTAADAKRTADLQPKPLEEPAAEVKMPVPNPQTVPVPPQPETEDGEEDDDEEEFELKPPKASVRNIIGKGFKKLGTMINNEVKNITDTEDEL